MTIDGRSLLAVAAALCALFGLVVLMLERRLSQPMAGLRPWAVANFGLGAGALLHALQGIGPPGAGTFAGHALLVAGGACAFAALRQFDDRPAAGRALTAGCLAFMILLAAAPLAWPESPIRSALMATAITLLCSACVATLALCGPPTVGRLVTTAGFGGLALVNLGGLLALAHAWRRPLAFDLDTPASGIYIGALLILAVVANLGFVLLITDRMHEWVLQLARTDHLTGTLSRGALYTQAQRDLHRARRQRTFTAAFIVDIDNFKTINDRFGHTRGDAVLRHVAQRGQAVLRCTDLFGRYGGDEFVAVLPETDLLSAAAIAERLRLAVSDLDAVPADGLPAITVSIGVAALPAGAHSVDDLVAQADAALYNAKNAGRNRTRVADDAQGPEKTSLHLLQGRR